MNIFDQLVLSRGLVFLTWDGAWACRRCYEVVLPSWAQPDALFRPPEEGVAAYVAHIRANYRRYRHQSAIDRLVRRWAT